MKAERPARLLLPGTATALSRGSRRSSDEARSVAAGGRADPVELDERGQEVFAALRAFRITAAREQQVPPYVIASDRTLREIASLRPLDESALLQIHGIGPAKAQKYGEALLAVVCGR